MLKDLVHKNRSYRRFYEDVAIEIETLYELIDLARLSASGRNAQPLKYFISTSNKNNSIIFTKIAWAAYLKDWSGPIEGERPSAYIILVLDKNISTAHFCDEGIAAQSILLGATEKGLGGCMIMSIKKEELQKELSIPEQFEILMVIALGKPKETIILEPMPSNGEYKYWRDENQVHHVPKRALKEIVLELKTRS
jgi:nitroreductase